MLTGDFDEVCIKSFKHLQETIAILMHHDSISATSRKVAITDFFLRIKKAFDKNLQPLVRLLTGAMDTSAL